jgi:hypothetical protein
MDTVPEWLEEIDPVVGPPFLRMGTRSLGSSWRRDGPDVAGQLAAKERILAAHPDDAVAWLPGTDLAAVEVVELVGGTPGPSDQHPLDQAGRLVAEDLCILMPDPDDPGRWILGAASLCFPSHWRLHDKLGRSVAAIHAPVPDYADELASRVDRFLDKLRVGAPVWRRNWTVHESPELYAPDVPPPPDPPITTADAGDRLWLRSEYQTLQRLPASGTILFGIRTQQVPLRTLAGRPDLCARFAAAARSWTGPFLAYRGGDAIRDPLVAWLADRVSGTGG